MSLVFILTFPTLMKCEIWSQRRLTPQTSHSTSPLCPTLDIHCGWLRHALAFRAADRPSQGWMYPSFTTTCLTWSRAINIGWWSTWLLSWKHNLTTPYPPPTTTGPTRFQFCALVSLRSPPRSPQGYIRGFCNKWDVTLQLHQISAQRDPRQIHVYYKGGAHAYTHIHAHTSYIYIY